MKKGKPMRIRGKSMRIDADTVRKLALNAESNPRETIYGEATQRLSPLTGRPYEDQFIIPGEFKNKYSSREKDSNGYLSRKGDPFNLIRAYQDILLLKRQGTNARQVTNETIELQTALGRMDVREGKISELRYGEFLYEIDRLADVYEQNPALTLDSITDVNGLNTALLAIERKTMPEKKLYNIEKELFNSDLFSKDKPYLSKHDFIEDQKVREILDTPTERRILFGKIKH